jgi:uncharacterized protein (TIGR02594 family)
MSSDTVKRIQQALLRQGFFPGEVDGIWGRRTIAAVKAFQEHVGIVVDGIVGPKTLAALFADNEALPETLLLPWLAEAQQLIGTKEVLGVRSNPVILDWAGKLDVAYPGDDIPWCGLFVAHCIGATMPDEILPANPLGARQWEKFGAPTEPRLGAVMVFWRESLTSGKGHVGFYTGEDGEAFRILGGNQGDQVCYAWISRSRLLKARWPHNAASLGGGDAIVVKNRSDGVSMDES